MAAMLYAAADRAIGNGDHVAAADHTRRALEAETRARRVSETLIAPGALVIPVSGMPAGTVADVRPDGSAIVRETGGIHRRYTANEVRGFIYADTLRDVYADRVRGRDCYLLPETVESKRLSRVRSGRTGDR
jgi:hypothetical protein